MLDYLNTAIMNACRQIVGGFGIVFVLAIFGFGFFMRGTGFCRFMIRCFQIVFRVSSGMYVVFVWQVLECSLHL